MTEPQLQITTSIFDIFKTGPGPSSSHTIGPMKAALAFREAMEKIQLPEGSDPGSLNIQVRLFGSLSLTGEGHGTHRAVLGGLLGWQPETCDCDALSLLLEDSSKIYEIRVKEMRMPFTPANIIYEKGDIQGLAHANTMQFSLTAQGMPILEKEYYSIGGGFIQCRGEIPTIPPAPPHGYHTMEGLICLAQQSGLDLNRIILENEAAVSGLMEKEILEKMDTIMDAMCASVDKGLSKDGVLPGPIGLQRKAKVLMDNAHTMPRETGRFLAMLNAYAMAASEENADGRRVVTAPTSGSAGVMPGIVYLLRHQYGLSRDQLRSGMLAAAAIAFVAKQNASLSGAEVGCQGEVGVASSMAAAFMAHAQGASLRRTEIAAEIALEHQLGMTCDPIQGYVQIPCIERNAVGAVTAANAYILAMAGDPARQKLKFDQVVAAMMATGKDMCTRYKETSLAGLALCAVSC